MSLEKREKEASEFEIIHDKIQHEGYLARDEGKLLKENPYSKIACEAGKIVYDEKKERS